MKQKKTIVIYIITELELGGAQKVCLNLFNHHTQWYETRLITSPKGYLYDSVADNPHAHFIPSLTRSIGAAPFLSDLTSFFAIVRILYRYKRTYSCIIVHTHSSKAGILGRWAAWCCRIPTRIHTIHGFAFHPHQSRLTHTILKFIETVTSLITTHFITVSSHDIAIGVQSFPSFDHKHTMIRAAIQEEEFKNNSADAIKSYKKNEPFIFGTISCFKPQKNIFDLLHAFEIVYQKNPLARLEIIGDGSLRTSIEAWISQRSLEQVICLHGWRISITPIIRQWDAFVLSSLWEGLPCSIVEAQYMGIPVVAYKTGGINDIIIHNHNGLLIEQKEWQALACAMQQIATNKTLYTHLQKNTMVPDAFLQATMRNAHAALYSSLIQSLTHRTSKKSGSYSRFMYSCLAVIKSYYYTIK